MKGEKRKFTMDDFRYGLMLLGFVSPANEQEIIAKEELDNLKKLKMEYEKRLHQIAYEEAAVRFNKITWDARSQEQRDREATKYYKEAERILAYCEKWYKAGLQDGEDSEYGEMWADKQCVYHGLKLSPTAKTDRNE